MGLEASEGFENAAHSLLIGHFSIAEHEDKYSTAATASNVVRGKH